MRRNRVSPTWLLSGILMLSGCTTVKSYWPFGRAPAPAAQPVAELELQAGANAPAPVVLQFWERNTLVIDLQSVSAAGEVVLARRAGSDWPARIALRMPPGRFAAVEVRGAQRVLVPVAAGTGAVTAVLPAAIYDRATAALMLRWGAKDSF